MSFTGSNTITKTSFDAPTNPKGYFDLTNSNSFIGSDPTYLNSLMESTARGNFDVGELKVKK